MNLFQWPTSKALCSIQSNRKHRKHFLCCIMPEISPMTSPEMRSFVPRITKRHTQSELCGTPHHHTIKIESQCDNSKGLLQDGGDYRYRYVVSPYRHVLLPEKAGIARHFRKSSKFSEHYVRARLNVEGLRNLMKFEN